MTAHDERDVQTVVEMLRLRWPIGRDMARAVLDALDLPARERRAKAEAWDEGYAVATDDFVHSDYCGFTCQCDGVHGQANPYRAAELDPEEKP
jgi:hypothetical protein